VNYPLQRGEPQRRSQKKTIVLLIVASVVAYFCFFSSSSPSESTLALQQKETISEKFGEYVDKANATLQRFLEKREKEFKK